MIVDYLKHAIIELTSECNLKCRHCYNWWKKEGVAPEHHNSYRKAFTLLEFLIKKTSVENITFTGGEPTISERFVELVLHAKLNGKRVTIITNGNGNPDIYRQLINLQVDLIEFSIHSSHSEIHDRITEKPGSWDKAMSVIKEVQGKGLRVTPVVVISALNHEYIEETVRFFFDMNIKSIMVNRYNMGGEGLNHPNILSASAKQLQTVFRKLNTFAMSHDIRIFSGVCTPHCLLAPNDYPNISFGSCSEDIYQRPLTFDINGNLRLCNHSPVTVGNIYEQTLGEILCSEYIDKWNNLNIPFCKSCSRLGRCRGGCRAASEQAGLSLLHEDPIINELAIQPFATK